MKINTKATSLSITPAISDYLDKRLSKIENIIGDDTTTICDVEIARTTAHHHKGEIFRAEVHITSKHHDVYASSDKEDLYMAIDDAVDEASRSLTSRRKKYTALARRGGAKVKAMVKGLWLWGKKI